MILRLTFINCADATNVRWSRVFHLYRGFHKRRAFVSHVVRASARRVTPPQPIYRNFKVKIYQKGDVARFIIVRTRVGKCRNRASFNTNHLLTLKRGLLPRSKYAYGPVIASTLHYKYSALFTYVIMSMFGHVHLYPSLLAPPLDATTSSATALFFETIPTVKLMYPEPFIATASSLHYDLWFLHILLYQYWLWFVFIFLIVFFFLMFLATIRWCNPRVKPRLETRGVSRSKCADLITACVPVTWATSIIVNETTDAIDFFDGFGTADIVIGVRAYQWGWEYYYPRDVDFITLYSSTPTLQVGTHALLYNNDASGTLATCARREQQHRSGFAPLYDDAALLCVVPFSAMPVLETNSFFLTQAVTKPFYIDTLRPAHALPFTSFNFFEYNAYAIFISSISVCSPYTAPYVPRPAINDVSAGTNSTLLTSTIWYDYDFKHDLLTSLLNDTYWSLFYDWDSVRGGDCNISPYLYNPTSALAVVPAAALYGMTHRSPNYAAYADQVKYNNPLATHYTTQRPLLYTSFFNYLTQDNSATAGSSIQRWFANDNLYYTRGAARTLLTSANAVQKVFKSRLDDTKSFLTLSDNAPGELTMPLVESGAYYTLRTFTKNSNLQHSYTTYNAIPAPLAPSALLALFNTTRWSPFLFFNASQSDAARYIWLDWYARWGMVSVQPASHSRYTLFGAPHVAGSSIKNGRNLWIDTETYFMRLARSRRAMYPATGLGATWYMHWIQRLSSHGAFSHLTLMAPAYSSFLLFKSSYCQPIFNIGSAYETAAHMHMAHYNNVIHMIAPKLLTPINKNTYAVESSRPKDTHIILKKGINNLIRLHATGAIAFPTEIRINILASSKDVIHSWAIPSAGIKIDCIPGYSSHRTFLFLLSGIFWGQCMEICGRYHHWMPIVVFFMKRDLFFLWCTHFIFLNGSGDESLHLNTAALHTTRPVSATRPFLFM